MKPLSARKLVKVLMRRGFTLVRQSGSHTIWKNFTKDIMVVIPLHAGTEPLPRGTFMAIIKQSKIPKDQFR
jgi:predicted RNA binding protein YcfA (HicA-like mRNA interferase family)